MSNPERVTDYAVTDLSTRELWARLSAQHDAPQIGAETLAPRRSKRAAGSSASASWARPGWSSRPVDRDESIETGQRCGSCGLTLPDLVWRVRDGRELVAMCESCGRGRATNPEPPAPCDGCGRMVVQGEKSSRRQTNACSVRCMRDGQAKVKREKRAEARPQRRCACGQMFTPHDSRQLHHTPACRVAALRERRRTSS
ncbi:MAG: hypothetical protein QOJ29_4281 [Thermoleophilaceae bacterium]|jgi:hypothetical protein|nr:hypothetical protein [Thermoleophilaceae bacterium]